MLKKIFPLIFMMVFINSCAVFYTDAYLGVQGEKLKYPVSFSMYLHDKLGNEVKAGSEQLKRIKHFELVLDKNINSGNVSNLDISDTLNSIVEKYNGDGIVNLEFSKPLVGGDTKGNIKYFFGQLGGSLISTSGIYYFSEKDIPTGLILLGAGAAIWAATTFLIDDNVQVIVKGDVVKWRK